MASRDVASREAPSTQAPWQPARARGRAAAGPDPNAAGARAARLLTEAGLIVGALLVLALAAFL
ncbi:MAG: hypothetical protein MUC68_13450, partial [Burkholderiaceae bacterium]|nr:hypothetical protein [Burkholderiaceae bacterium]